MQLIHTRTNCILSTQDRTKSRCLSRLRSHLCLGLLTSQGRWNTPSPSVAKSWKTLQLRSGWTDAQRSYLRQQKWDAAAGLCPRQNCQSIRQTTHGIFSRCHHKRSAASFLAEASPENKLYAGPSCPGRCRHRSFASCAQTNVAPDPLPIQTVFDNRAEPW